MFIMFSTGCTNQPDEITLDTLLVEMTDREQLAIFPDPSYTCKQFSSYNQTSVNPEDYTWFANLDNNYFLRTEENNGHREFVLFDAEGPGAVVRFWATFARYDKEGILRFYFDNQDEPRIAGEAMDILSGGELVGFPLSFSVSEESDYSRRGHNLYLPLPYSGRLKITYESDGIEEARDGINEVPGRNQEMFYYQINYRTYKPGVRVETFQQSSLETYRKVIEETLESIEVCDRGLDGLDLKTIDFSGRLAPDEKKHISIKGSQTIRKILLKLKAENLEQALRSTVIQVAFDGQQTIWAPAGDFFGAGYKIIPTKTWYQEVGSDGTLQVFWVMPFQKTCDLTIINYGDQEVEIENAEISRSKWKWDKQSMHFGSSWYQNTRINTGLVKTRDGQGDMFDINYTTLNGQGVYVGDGVTLFNCSPAWWGEGDEKIFVDKEDFPSHFGTGTEDYYGYAWCRPEKFIHPFISQPDGSGNLNVGYTLNMRYRTLDAIPFHQRLLFDMELWHWGNTIMNHAPITFWYIMPGGNCEMEHDVEGVRESVVQSRDQLIPPVMNDQNIIEGEDMIISNITGDGSARIRPIPVPDKPNWTRSAMVWTHAMAGDSITFQFIFEDPGRYGITGYYFVRNGNTRLNFLINGETVLTAPGKQKRSMEDDPAVFRAVELSEGYNEMTVIVMGATRPDGIIFGVDYLKFKKL